MRKEESAGGANPMAGDVIPSERDHPELVEGSTMYL